MEKVIARDSLLGMAIGDAYEAAHAASTDAEGYTDYEDLEYNQAQVDFLETELEEAADVLSVFAEEATRFAA